MLYFLILIQVACSQLLMIKQIFRHGIRQPVTTSFSSTPKPLLGQLTNGGKRMQFLLGKALYDTYWAQLGLNNSYHPSYIRVNSSDYDRAIESAQAQLYGMFAGLKKEVVKDTDQAKPDWNQDIVAEAGKVFPNMDYQTVPIHVEKRLGEAYSQPVSVHSRAVDICPNSYMWLNENQKSHFYKKQFKPILDRSAAQLKVRFGGVFDIDRVTSLMDVYYSNISQGLPLHSIFKNEKLKKDLEYIYLTRLFVEAFLTPHQINTSISSSFISLRQQMRAALEGTGPKIYLQSLHDANLVSHMTALQLMGADCSFSAYRNSSSNSCITEFPPFSANLIYELHRDANSSEFVKVRYNGKYKKLAFCGYPCYYEDFEKFLNETIVANYREVCGFVVTEKSKVVVADTGEDTGYIIGIALLSFVILSYFMYKMLTEVIERTHRVIVLPPNGQKIQSQMVQLQPAKSTQDLPQSDVLHP